MKTVKITSNNKISVVEVDFNNFRSIQNAIGGRFETVHTKTMKEYFKDAGIVLLVDEEFLLKGLPVNRLGCWFYNTFDHGAPICGDFILGKVNGEDIIGPKDAEEIKKQLIKDFAYLKEEIA